ncbi:hypothetical protein [Niabella beijingensis]|nr:hypothetical protein [Niabella beijingensis]MBZ4189863.1 hypothetical protein [Niabella beijingensis]
MENKKNEITDYGYQLSLNKNNKQDASVTLCKAHPAWGITTTVSIMY